MQIVQLTCDELNINFNIVIMQEISNDVTICNIIILLFRESNNFKLRGVFCYIYGKLFVFLKFASARCALCI